MKTTIRKEKGSPRRIHRSVPGSLPKPPHHTNMNNVLLLSSFLIYLAAILPQPSNAKSVKLSNAEHKQVLKDKTVKKALRKIDLKEGASESAEDDEEAKPMTVCFLIEKANGPKDCEFAYSYGSVRKWDCSKVGEKQCTFDAS